MALESVRVFCMEMFIDKNVDTPLTYRLWLEKALAKARLHYPKDNIHRLLVFPEFVSLPLIFNEDTFTKYIDEFIQLFSKMAVDEKAYILTCGPSRKNNKFYNEAFLFDPLGNCIFTTCKYNLTDEENILGFIPSVTPPKVITLPFGVVGVAICLDAFSTPYIKSLKKLGASIILQPSANPQSWLEKAKLSNVWQPLEWTKATAGMVAPENVPISYLINPMLRGLDKNGTYFDGQSSIVCASSDFLSCPYQGVTEKFQAKYVYCSSYENHSESQIGWHTIDGIL